VDAKTISLLSSILGLTGGILLAYSLNRVIGEVRFSIDALSTSIASVASSGNVYVFQGLDKRLKTANKISNSWVRSGIYCLVASVILAAYAIYAA
jgi:hypothetical protein